MNPAIQTHLAVLAAVADVISDQGHHQTSGLISRSVDGILQALAMEQPLDPEPEPARKVKAPVPEPAEPKPSRRKAPATEADAAAAGATFVSVPPVGAAPAPKTVAEALASLPREGLKLATLAAEIGATDSRATKDAAMDAWKVLLAEWPTLDTAADLESWLAANEPLLADISAVSPNAAGAVNAQREKIKVKLEGMQ